MLNSFLKTLGFNMDSKGLIIFSKYWHKEFIKEVLINYNK